MIWHQTIGEQLHRVASQAFGQHTFERIEVFRLMENTHPAITTI